MHHMQVFYLCTYFQTDIMLCQSHDPTLGIWSDFVKKNKVFMPHFWVFWSFMFLWAFEHAVPITVPNFGSWFQFLIWDEFGMIKFWMFLISDVPNFGCS